MPDNPYIDNQSATINPYIEYEEPAKLRSEFYKARNAAMAYASIKGQSPLTAAQEFAFTDNISAMSKARAAIKEAYGEANNSMHQYYLNNPARGGELAPYKQQVETQLFQSIDNADDTELLIEETASIGVDEMLRQELAVHDRIMYMMDDDMRNTDLADKAINMAELLVPFFGSSSIDAADLTKGSFFSTKEDFKRIALAYNQLKPADKEAFASVFYQAAVEAADGNELIAQELMLNFLSPQATINNQWIDKTLVGVDIATLGTALVSKVSRIIKGGNAIMRSRKLASEEEAAQIAAVAATNSSAAKLAGVSQVEAAYTAQPMFMHGILDNVPEDIARYVEPMIKQLDEATSMRVEYKGIVEKQILDERLKDLEKSVEVVSAEFVPRVDMNTPAKMLVKISKEGVEEVKELTAIGADEMGVFKTVPKGWFSKLMRPVKEWTSPATQFTPDVDRLVNLPTNVKNYQARMGKIYADVQKQHIKNVKKLKPDEQRGYKAAISAGSKEGKEWSPQELEEFFHLKSKEGQAAYYEQRTISQYQWEIKSSDIYEKYLAEGFDTFMTLGSKQQRAFGKVSENPSATINELTPNKLWDDFAQTAITPQEALEAVKNGNLKLVRLKHNVDMSDGNSYNLIITRDDFLRQLDPHDVLPKLDGYVPKIHTEANYFVTTGVKGSVNGVEKGFKYSITDQAFSTKKGAEDYILSKFDNLEDARAAGVDIRFDREYDSFMSDGAGRNYNGLFTGKRKTDGLLVDGKLDWEIADHEKAMTRYFENLATQGLYEPIKRELQATWLKTYKDLIPAHRQHSFKDAYEGMLESVDPNKVAIAKNQHDFISYLSGFKTDREKSAHRWIRSLAQSSEWSDKIVSKWLKSGNTVSGHVKEMMFHMNLGLFNPAQLLVQGSGAFISFGAHPAAFTKMMPHIMGILKAETGAFAMPNTNVANLWLKSGMSEGVNLQADIMEMMQRRSKVVDATSYFFSLGEKTNRVAAFATAYDVVRAKKGLKVLTNEHLPDIMNLANNLTLNFSSVNKAKWQNGWLGVITQFQQVWEKSFNQIYNPFVKGPLTKAERLRAGITQASLFGMVGLPVNWAFKYVDENLTNMGADEEIIEAVHRGLIGALPTKMDFAGRLAVGSEISNFWLSTITGNMYMLGDFEQSLRRGMFGIAGQTVARLIDGYARVHTALEGNDIDTVTNELFRSTASLFATTRNLDMAVLVYGRYHEIRNSKGKVISKADLHMLDQFLLGMGFQLKEVQDYYYARNIITSQDNALSAMADRIVRVYGDRMSAFDVGSISTYDEELGDLGAITASLTWAQKRRLLDMIDTRLKNDKAVLETFTESIDKEYRPEYLRKYGVDKDG